MFGSHHSANGYSNSELAAGNYSFFPSHPITSSTSDNDYSQPSSGTSFTSVPMPSVTQNNHFYHPHLYSPSAAEYGITTTNNSPSDELYYDSTPTGIHSLHNSHAASGPPAHLIQDHIISSENGLSYTNLDYMYSQSHGNSLYLHSEDKLILSNSYNPVNDGLCSHHAPGQHSSPASSSSIAQNAWQNNIGYTDSSTVHHQVGLGSLSNVQNQSQLRPLVVTTGRSQSQASANALTPQTQQPTYKWMQVKRNVPKPQSMYIFIL